MGSLTLAVWFKLRRHRHLQLNQATTAYFRKHAYLQKTFDTVDISILFHVSGLTNAE